MKDITRRAQIGAVLGMALLAGACTATPDLGGWAQNSAELAGAVAGENRIVLTRIDTDIVELRVGEKEGWRLGRPPNDQSSAKWEGYRDDYFEATQVINASMDAMVLYANALAELAAKGETGKEASEKIIGSFEDILATVGAAYPGTAAVKALFSEVAAIVTKVQAQDALAETMTALQPAVDKLAGGLKTYAASQENIIQSIRGLESTLYLQSAGPNRMSWYVRHSGYKRVEEVFARDDALHMATNTYLVQTLEPRYRAYRQRLADRDNWVKKRLDSLDKITAAADAWRRSHEAARDTLVACGGVRSLRFDCGAYNAANLKLAAERIRNVVSPSSPQS